MSEKDKKAIIAKRLSLARKQAGLSQIQVAKLLKFHRPTISEIEAGRRSVSAEELIKFSEIYSVDIEWLTDVTGTYINFKKDKIELAARELSKIKEDDLDTILNLLISIKGK